MSAVVPVKVRIAGTAAVAAILGLATGVVLVGFVPTDPIVEVSVEGADRIEVRCGDLRVTRAGADPVRVVDPPAV